MRFLIAIAAAWVIVAAGNAEAVLIVDTGTPTGAPSWSFSSSQYFAGEFLLGSDTQINSIEGYFNSNYGSDGNVEIAVHSDGGNIPGGILFSTALPVAGGTAFDWHGAFGLNWNLSAGTYWVSFKPDADMSGTMPGTATNPLDAYAQGSGNYAWLDWGPVYFNYLDVGLRIDAENDIVTPEPVSLAIWGGLGLVGLAAARRRKQQK